MVNECLDAMADGHWRYLQSAWSEGSMVCLRFVVCIYRQDPGPDPVWLVRVDGVSEAAAYVADLHESMRCSAQFDGDLMAWSETHVEFTGDEGEYCELHGSKVSFGFERFSAADLGYLRNAGALGSSDSTALRDLATMAKRLRMAAELGEWLAESAEARELVEIADGMAARHRLFSLLGMTSVFRYPE